MPPRGEKDKADFYRRISKAVSEHRAELGSIDASDTEMVLDDHPAVEGLGRFIRVTGLSNASFAGNMFKGFYLPDGIIMRSDL